MKIRENEEKEIKVVKGNQIFWFSESWASDLRKSNKLHINVQDSIVELEVGCNVDENLWIREKSQ